MPRTKRFTALRKNSLPAPTSYQNTYEVAAKTTLRHNGNYSIGRQERKVDFTKFSNLHSSLVAKGLF